MKTILQIFILIILVVAITIQIIYLYGNPTVMLLWAGICLLILERITE